MDKLLNEGFFMVKVKTSLHIRLTLAIYNRYRISVSQITMDISPRFLCRLTAFIKLL